MKPSSLFKQLKKRLRLRKRWLSLGFFITAALVAASLYSFGAVNDPAPADHDARPADESVAASTYMRAPDAIDASAQSDALQRIQQGGPFDVYTNRMYVCGQIQEHLGTMGAEEVLSFHREHPDWRIEVEDHNRKVVFMQQINDLSPECKENTYFGLDKDGNLSLFDGPPQDEKVLRTFFQMNIEYLESSLPPDTVRQLREGIPIADLAEYNSVLSTFSEFALEQSEAM